MSPVFANNKGVDQPAHLRRLIIAFVIRCFESIISKLATSEISIFRIDSVAERLDESRFVGNPEGRFSRVEAQLFICVCLAFFRTSYREKNFHVK